MTLENFLSLFSFSIDLRWRNFHAGVRILNYEPNILRTYWYQLYFAKVGGFNHKLEKVMAARK